MADKNEILQLLYDAIDDYNSVVSKEIQLGKTEDTLLFDPMSVLDSIGIVQIRTAVESRLEERYGVTESYLLKSREYPGKNPFRTVRSTVDYITWFLEGIKK